MVALSQEAVGRLVQQGRYREALAGCRRLLAARPRDAWLLYLQAHCLQNLGQMVEALVAAQAALRLAPKVPVIRLQEAEILNALGRHGQAAQAYEALLALPSERPDQIDDSTILDSAFAGLAESRAAQGDHDAALAAARRLEARNPKNPGALNAVASCLILAGWARQAVAVLERAIVLSEGTPPAQRAPILHNLAKAAADAGDLSAAVEHARAAAEAALLPGPCLQLGLAAFEAGALREALEHFEEALNRQPRLALAMAYRAAVLLALGDVSAAREGFAAARALRDDLAAFEEAVDYAQAAGMPPARGFKATVLREALAAAPEKGLVLEFGVYTGRSIAWLAEGADAVHGFDSFQGLPDDWTPEVKAGGYSTTGRLPQVPPNVTLHVGWFEKTLPAFLAQEAGPLRLANIDCDVYSSTRCVLEALAPRLVVGSILVFDEYFTYPGWRDHEWKAFQELVAARGLAYRYLSLSPFTRQAAIEITGL